MKRLPSAPQLSALALVVSTGIVLSGALLLAGPARWRPVPYSVQADLVTLQILVSGADSAPVPDLRAEELTVRVNGRPRPVRSLQFVPVPGAAGPASAAFDGPPPFGTNRLREDGRAVLLLVDDESIAPGEERRMRESVEHLIAGFSPLDRVALLSVPHGGARTEFTGDMSVIRQAVSQIVGRAQSRSGLLDMSCQTKQTLEAVRSALSSFRRGSGLPMVVVLSGGLMGPRRELEVIGSARAPFACDIRTEDFQLVARSAIASQAHFWVARMETLALPSAPVEDAAGRSSNMLVGLEQLAGATRGPLVNLTGSDGRALRRIVTESSGYYVARFEPDASDRTGQPRSLDIRVSRPGTSVRALPEIVLDAVSGTAAKAGPVTPESLLRVTAMYRDLPLRSTVYVARASGTMLRLAAMGEAADAASPITAAAIGLIDGSNRLVGQWSATEADLPGRLAAAFAAPTGSYRARIAAVDALGRLGTADYPFTAELVPAGALRLSDIVLGVSRESGFVPRLQFGTEPVVTAYIEIYGAQGGANVQAVFELALSQNGPARISQPAAFSATNEPDKFVGTAALPIAGLPPGDYVVRATIGLEGQPSARVLRTLRKEDKR